MMTLSLSNGSKGKQRLNSDNALTTLPVERERSVTAKDGKRYIVFYKSAFTVQAPNICPFALQYTGSAIFLTL